MESPPLHADSLSIGLSQYIKGTLGEWSIPSYQTFYSETKHNCFLAVDPEPLALSGLTLSHF